MSAYIWYSKTSSVTGRALREALSIEGGVYAPKRRHDIVVCYGAVPKTVQPTRLAGKVVLNDAFNVREYTNKYIALLKLKESGVPVPLVSKCMDIPLPVVRRPDRHHGGLSFNVGRDTYPATLHNHHYMQFIEHVDRLREYRFHVWCGEVVKVSRKKAKTLEANTDCKSHANGWYFSKCDTGRISDALKSVAVQAVEALGYNFGAVDIIYIPNKGTYVLEVNSGPGLDNSGLELYTSLIRCFIQDTIGGQCR